MNQTVIDLTNLCYYDKRNPDCTADDEDIEDHKRILLEKNKTCSCDNCFYGRTELTEQLILQSERMYSEEEVKNMLIHMSNYINTRELKDNSDLNFDKWIKKRDWFINHLFEQFKKK